MKHKYKVFYLTGGYSNFTCKAVAGLHNNEEAQQKVEELKRMGYKAKAIKDGHIIGGLCSRQDFKTESEARKYFETA